MKEIELLPTSPDEYIDYYDEITNYVYIFAQKHFPLHEENYQCHIYSAAYEYFNMRYIDNKIDKSFLKRYEDDEELLDMITSLGYDYEKFWYMLLFIYDYSYCACKREVEFHKDKYEYLEDIHKYIGEEGAELTLKVKGKKKVEITEIRSLELIQKIIKQHLDSIGEIKERTYKPINKDLDIRKENSNSYQIWYFAKMFLQFFEVVPPKNIRRKKDEYNSYSTKLLISKLVYLVKLSYNESFNDSESTLNGFLKQYKDESIYSTFVMEYL
jgi:ribosomal 50S subunit-associated protein YjgA (DUF615 family)